MFELSTCWLIPEFSQECKAVWTSSIALFLSLIVKLGPMLWTVEDSKEVEGDLRDLLEWGKSWLPMTN